MGEQESPNALIGEAQLIMSENKIGGIPIVDENNHLVGILTNRDLRFRQDKLLKVSDLMTTKNLILAPEGTTLKQAEGILHENKIETRKEK